MLRANKFALAPYNYTFHSLMQNTLRTFFAIDIPETEKATIERWKQSLPKETLPKYLRWVVKEKLHITLQFIGQLPPEKATPLIEQVSTRLNSFHTFELQTNDEVKPFPSLHKPRCLILKLTPEEPLITLAHLIGEAMLSVGLTPEKRSFKPHLTLARLDMLPKKLPPLRLSSPLQFQVNEVVFLQSHSERNKTAYIFLKRFNLPKVPQIL